MHEQIADSPTLISASQALQKAHPELFQEPPSGHFWLEHLVKTLADQRAHPDSSAWLLFGAEGQSGEMSALYAVNRHTGYAMLHGVEHESTAFLLRWALTEKPPQKVFGVYLVLERAIETAHVSDLIYRDHRELFLNLRVGELSVTPDWNYRLATYADVPRLKEYNRLYNKERETNWSRDWDRAISNRSVYVREREGTISSCLLRGALLSPWISFGGVFTFPEFRGLGEATMLVADFCAEMFLSGLNTCLIVDDDNTPAIRAYTKAGFTPAALYRTTYFRPLNADHRRPPRSVPGR